MPKNINAGGLFINLPGNFEPGSSVKLVFSLLDAQRPFELNGHILRTEENGQFNQLSPYCQKFLDEQLRKP
ncbi:MAG: PilZ domain-containing protein [Desulfotignum sp.]|nr:PilZ domain-containing protein [Desulfobacteraceae bacterium]